MQSHEIPSEQWVPFFNKLSERHRGEHVKVELLGRHFGDHHFPDDQSLVGISVNPSTGACKVDVRVEDRAGSSVAHEISHPIHVRLSQNDAGSDTALVIDTCSGPCTLVRFLSAAAST